MRTNCENYIRKVFSLPRNSSITFENKKSTEGNNQSIIECHITVQKKGKMSSFIIKKPLEAITNEDVDLLYQSSVTYNVKHSLFKKALLKIFGWWFIFGGALTIFSVCPICGQVGCPVGFGTTGLLAGFFAFVKQYGIKIFYKIKILFIRNHIN